MTPEKVAHLSWLSAPIKKYIERCKQAMVNITALRDRLKEPPVGAEPIWFVNQNEKMAANVEEMADLVAGIAASLDVVRCTGGFVLTNEVRTLANVALSSMGAEDQDKSLLAIQSALNVLPSYIGMVIDGAHDSPGVLLKYINELRALRNVPALNDDTALPLNLSFAYKSPPLHETDCDLIERDLIFKKAAANFCLLYSKAMKDSDDSPWIEMREHLRELQRVTNDPELGCYWWVGEAIIDVIIADRCYLPPAMNTSLRVVMVATQRLPQGEAAAKESLSPAKFSALLNSLSVSRKQTSTSAEVIKHFDVQHNVEESRIVQLQQMLTSHSVQTITDVIPEIKPRLEAGMIAFGRAVTAKSAEGFAIQKQAFDQAIRTIANIFGIFNESELSEVSFYLADMVKGVNGAAAFTPEVIDTVKTQILFLDSKLIHMQRNEAADQLQIENVTSDVIGVIANETYAELRKVSHVIATHVDSGVGSEKLLTALNSLHELANVYEFAGSMTIANILAAIVTVISDEVKGSVLSETEPLTLAARALVSVEMYLQYITSGLQPPANLMEVATSAVRDLGLDVSEFRIVSHSDLLAKFDTSTTEDDGLDALLREIVELRPQIEGLQKSSKPSENDRLSQYATACLRISAAAMIQGEKSLAKLCRYTAELAKVVPGRVDDPAFDSKAAQQLLVRANESILRSMDEYASKGKVHLFLLDAIDEVAAFIGHVPSTQAEVSGGLPNPEPDQSSAVAERTVPEGYDAQLLSLFNEDLNEQLGILKEFLSGKDLTVTERECRAIHTIHGCSGSASCTAIATLFDVLESRFYAIKAKDESLTEVQANDLRELLNEVEQYRNDFPWITETALLPAWLEIAGSMNGPESTDHEVDLSHKSAEEVPTPSVAVTETSFAPTSPIVVASESAVPSTPVFESDRAKTQRVEEPLSLEYDLDQYELYLCDADDVIPALQQNIQSWMENMADKELAITIRRNMHTLKGAASIINATGIRTLTHHMESLFDAMASGSIIADQHCADLTTFVLNELIAMSDAVRNRRPYRTIPALNDLIATACELSRLDGEALGNVIQSSYGGTPSAPINAHVSDSPDVPSSQIEAPSATKLNEEEADAQSVDLDQPQGTELSIQAGSPTPSKQQRTEFEDSSSEPNESSAKVAAEPEWKYRRGYRGMRGRATQERQHNWENRQARKALTAEGAVFDPADYQGEPDYTEIDTAPVEISEQALKLIQRATESDRESARAKKKTNNAEKIKVELHLLDNSVKLSNELKASSYRQSTLHREMVLSIVALREKLSLHLIHHNKTTVQLRNFNNMTNHFGAQSEVESGSEEQRLYLERFNHLSNGNTQAGVQIEQMLQDVQDIITQSNLMVSAFKYQGEVVASLQRDLLLSRLVQFSNERPSLTGALTSALQVTQKKAQLDLLGSDTLIDRQMLESIRDPLRHVITNCVAHGIESPEERTNAGKPVNGLITVKASRRAKSLIIEVSDDGRGIDPDVIRQKALSLGLIKPDDSLSDQEVIYLITEGGFSTANMVNELAGRGVGMDIVRSKIVALGGHLHIRSEKGKGTTMELELPLTVGSNRALVCKVSDQWYAIPTYNMVQVMDYPTTDLLAIKAKPGQASIVFDGKSYDVVHLADLIAVPDLKLVSAQAPSHTGLVLVEQGNTRLAIEVERGISMPEIHVTKFEGILSGVKGIIGSTEVHDGTPALVLDVIELARLNLTMTKDGYKPKLYRIRRVRREAKPLVLVVDDSNAFRKLLTSHFQGLGWEVATARDGQDAIDKLPTLGNPTLFVVDVEMPRMDGLVLTKRLRSQRHFDETPIIMLTTRTNLRDTALELGVNQFLTKPYDAAILNEAIQNVCPALESVGAA